jgi:hypothetical protein
MLEIVLVADEVLDNATLSFCGTRPSTTEVTGPYWLPIFKVFNSLEVRFSLLTENCENTKVVSVIRAVVPVLAAISCTTV